METEPQTKTPRTLWRRISSHPLVDGWVKPIVLALIIVLPIKSTVIDAYEVNTGSMQPTIVMGDRFFVSHVRYGLRVPFTGIELVRFAEPQHGDIVVFLYPGDESVTYIKRIIGVPGDRVAVRGGVVWLNGKRMKQRSLPGLTPSYFDDVWDAGNRVFMENLDGIDHYILDRKSVV